MVEAKRCCFCGKAARSNAPKTKLLNSLDGLEEASASECTAHIYHLICMCGRVSVSQSVSQYRAASRSQIVHICLSLSVSNYPSPSLSICLPLAHTQLRYDQLMANFRGTGSVEVRSDTGEWMEILPKLLKGHQNRSSHSQVRLS